MAAVRLPPVCSTSTQLPDVKQTSSCVDFTHAHNLSDLAVCNLIHDLWLIKQHGTKHNKPCIKSPVTYNIHKTIYGWHCCTPPCRIQLASLVPRRSLSPWPDEKIKTVFIFLSMRGESMGTRVHWSSLTVLILIRIIYDELFHQFSTSNLNLLLPCILQCIHDLWYVVFVLQPQYTMSIFVLYST